MKTCKGGGHRAILSKYINHSIFIQKWVLTYVLGIRPNWRQVQIRLLVLQ